MLWKPRCLGKESLEKEEETLKKLNDDSESLDHAEWEKKRFI